MFSLHSDKIDRYIYLSECPSTNDAAINLPSNSDPNHNICIYTFNQTAGRGQIGRFWYSGTDKNLTSTYKIPFRGLDVEHIFKVNIAFSLAIKDFVSSLVVGDVKIKWPNDIYVGDKKIAGILIQNNLQKSSIKSSLMGVGINILSTSFPQVAPNPVSVIQLAQRDNDADWQTERECLASLQHLLSGYIVARLKEATYDSHQQYRSYQSALYRLNTSYLYLSGDQQIEGIIRGVTDQGQLELEVNGVIRYFDFHQVKYVL